MICREDQQRVRPPFNINPRRYEDSFRPNNSKFQEDSSEAVGNDGGRQCRCHPLNDKGPNCSVFAATPDKRESQGGGSP